MIQTGSVTATPRIRRSTFKPAWWLPGGHLQTLYATYLKHSPPLKLETEAFELPDGDCTRGFWRLPRNPDRPLVILLPGLEGDAQSPYIRSLADRLGCLGYEILILPFRGTRSNPNRRRESYHAGWTADLDWVVECYARREPAGTLAVIGFSLGGNMLLRWLASASGAARVRQAIGVSIPFDLACVAHRMGHGAARFYQSVLVRELRRAARGQMARFGHPTLSPAQLRKLRTFLEFDGRYVAPLYGFRDAEDYYKQTNSRAILDQIRTPTLLLQSLDDPIIPGSCLPQDSEWSASTVVEWSPSGGHVGFISGRRPFSGHAWLDERILEALGTSLGVPGSPA